MKFLKGFVANIEKIIGGFMVIVGTLLAVVGLFGLPRRLRKKVEPCVVNIEFIRKN